MPFEVALRLTRIGPWRVFQQPEAVIVARRPEQVRDALVDIDRRVRIGGYYAAGFITYEAAGGFGLPVKPVDKDALPLVCFGVFPRDQVMTATRLHAREAYEIGDWCPAIEHDGLRIDLGRLKTHLGRDGVSQLNDTMQMRATFTGDPLGLFCDLDAAEAGQWSAFVDAGRHAICSAGSDLFFHVEDSRVVCRPVYGAAARGLSADQDARQADALRAASGIRAGHGAIVDLVRADLTRLAQAGRVDVAPSFDVERSPLEWRIASTVAADVREPSLAAIVEGLFPFATVTGVPRRASMQIIRDHEAGPRGLHGGAIGYLSPNGRGHFTIATRTIAIDRERGCAEMGVERLVVPDTAGSAPDGLGDRVRRTVLAPTRDRPGASAVPRAPLSSYSVSHGVRLLETIGWTVDSGFKLLDRHLKRLGDSAACFAFDCDLAAVRAMLDVAVDDLRGPAKVRILLGRDGTIVCEAVDAAAPPEAPLTLAVAPDPIDPSDVFLYHKTTRREVYERARAARPDVDAVLLWNRHGEVTESTEANIVVEIDGERRTPPVECGLLPGTMRAELLERRELVERPIVLQELKAAGGIWLINSVRGWTDVRLVAR